MMRIFLFYAKLNIAILRSYDGGWEEGRDTWGGEWGRRKLKKQIK